MVDRRTVTHVLGAAVVSALAGGMAASAGPTTATATAPPPKPARTTTATPATPAARPAPAAPATLIYQVETTDPVVFLTIDDGAVREPDTVAALKQHGVRPTMFLTRSYVDADPAYFRALCAETGGVVENHTATHRNLAGLPAPDQDAEIGPVSDHYASVFGTRPTLFRAPYGSGDAVTLAAAGRAGAKYDVRWGSEITAGVIAFAGPHEFRPGSIVLTHFRHGFRRDVEAFAAQARLNGLTPALLTDYLR
jgi:peptidoglycan/xylan/chitin deacetylase (PgdA/CDA1 family)